MDSPKARAVSSLRDFIRRSGMRAGDRLPAETRLAAEFEVSRVTLRSALDVLEREGIIRRERNLGCFCAVSADADSSLMSRTLVLLSDHLAASNDQDFGGTSASVVSGVIDRAGRAGMHFLRANLDDPDETWLGQLVGARPRGFVLSSWHHPVDWQLNVLRALSVTGLPIVVGGSDPAFAAFDRVVTDHVGGTRQLVEVLARHGRKHILRLWSPPRTSSFIQEHDHGYELGVAECGLEPLPPTYVPNLAGVPIDIQTEEQFQVRVRYLAGYLVEHLRPDNPVDAIMVATDAEALAVLAACRLFGRTDVVVTGYDNRWQSEIEHQWERGRPFATVDKANHRLGEEMVDMLVDRINGALPPEPQKRLIEQQVIVTS
jgi:DNA-binding LacI/PurR family transcriptional regulator